MQTRFIPGIYNYCNRWCERCPHTARCLLFAHVRYYEDVAAGRDALDPDDDLGPPSQEAEAFLKELQQADSAVTEEDLAEFERQEAAVRKRIDEDPLMVLARGVAMTLWRWSTSETAAGSDAVLAEARDVIAHYGVMLGPKTHRALHGYYEARGSRADEFAGEDANGTAKVVLLALAALTPAVEVLALAFPDDPALRQSFAELPVLTAWMVERFPKAMSVVRPGLDDNAAMAQ
jgi:hypothetical protein